MALLSFLTDSQDTQPLTLRKHARIVEAVNGLRGKTIITDANAHTPATGHEAWCSIYALTATVLASVADGAADATPITALSLPAGQTLKGYFTSIQLTSGSVIAHYL